MEIEKLNDPNCFYYRGCEAQKRNDNWFIFIHGEPHEISDCQKEEVKEYIDSIIDR